MQTYKTFGRLKISKTEQFRLRLTSGGGKFNLSFGRLRRHKSYPIWLRSHGVTIPIQQFSAFKIILKQVDRTIQKDKKLQKAISDYEASLERDLTS